LAGNLRIGFDARELSKPGSGGFRSYIRGLLAGLAEVDQENEYILYVDRPLDREHIALPVKCTTAQVSRNRIYADHFDLRRAIRRDDLDLVHFPCNYGIAGLTTPMVISLHDCIGLKTTHAGASLKTRLLLRYFAAMTRRSAPKADAVITVSEYSRGEIVSRFGMADRVHVTYDAINPALNREASESAPGLVEGDYYLCLASPDPRKNVQTMIRVFLKSGPAAEGCRLVVVANHASARDMVLRASGGSPAVIVLEDVGDGDLARLYRNGVAFVFASLEEGFGLPALEAMALGCPVISSSAPAMPEVLGDAALYFDPRSESELAERLESVWTDEALRENLRALGRERGKTYSWRRTAEQTLVVYRRVAAAAMRKNSTSQRAEGKV
jgi:glycosyltransferase involved in cell wall biosynthesis